MSKTTNIESFKVDNVNMQVNLVEALRYVRFGILHGRFEAVLAILDQIIQQAEDRGL